jgi:protein-S-isoprenylcysteine O-methyltransferase Ste14
MGTEREVEKRNRPLRIPRWAIPVVWTVIVLLIMVLAPWAVSRIGPRYGWNPDGAGTVNNLGLLAVIAGLGMYAWCLVFHFRSYRTSVEFGFSPPELVVTGPYQVSRNPMYVAGLFTWLGWTIFFGSPAVLIALALLWVAFSFRVIPYEENQLEDLFGQDYLQYKSSVRRWFGRYQ